MKKFIKELNSTNEIFLELEFRLLTPLECLLKICRENKRHEKKAIK